MHAISSIFKNTPETTYCIEFPQFLSQRGNCMWSVVEGIVGEKEIVCGL
jgi:hypothetical protein